MSGEKIALGEDYVLTNFVGDEEVPTARAGFYIFKNSVAGTARIKCYEGFNLSDQDPEIIEPETFEIAYLGVPVAMERQHIGTRLAELALQEGKSRGFSLARAHINSPRTLRIFEHLEAKGQIEALRFTGKRDDEGRDQLTPTKAYISQGTSLDYQTAADYLRALALQEGLEKADRDFVSIGVIDAAFALK